MSRAEPDNRDLFAIADLAKEFGISTRAIRFYERHGYRPTGRVSDFFGMELIEYAKELGGRR